MNHFETTNGRVNKSLHGRPSRLTSTDDDDGDDGDDQHHDKWDVAEI